MPAMSKVERAFCMSAPWRVFARRAVLPWALANRTLEGDVLEIGGGSGAMAGAILQRFPSVRLVVTDTDEAMTGFARSRLGEHGERVKVQRADVTQLPFEDATFDAVLSFIMLHHVIEWELGLGEVARVLRPGGVLIGYDLTDSIGARRVHHLDGSPHKLISPNALRTMAGKLALDGEVVPRFGSRLMRFALTRTP